MKKVNFLAILFVYTLTFFSGCGSDPQKDIIGYWMRKDGYTISFVDETNCSFSENSLETYKIYDGNHLQVVNYATNSVSEFVFEINGDTLKLRLPTEDVYTEFTKNEKEQKKIIEEVRERENIEFEEEMLQGQVDSIQEKISNITSEINKIQNEIDWNNLAIQNNRNDIERWKEEIQQEYINCEENISGGMDREYSENERDDFIVAYNESIQSCNERIKKLEAENVEYQNMIATYQSEIEKLQKEELNLFSE
ncbi:MAG: hypothetical protein ACI4AO_05230 [Anaerotignum sp.]